MNFKNFLFFNYLNIIIVLTIFFYATGCDEKLHNNCFGCTEEFRMSLVTILDLNNNPLDSVTITVKNKFTGEYFDVSQYNNPPFQKGEYVIFHDGFLDQVVNETKYITVFAEIDTVKAVAEFAFTSDECNCHILKISGPDSIWIDVDKK